MAATRVLFNDSHNNLTVSIDAPDTWNAGAALAYIHKLNWTGYGLATMNDDLNAFFSITSLPPIVNFALPMGQVTGMFSSLLSQYVTVNDEYEVPFSDGSRGHAYSFSINSDQFGRLNSMFPSVNKPIDGVLITVQQEGQNYAILYFTDFGKLSQYTIIFQGILESLKFQNVGGSTIRNSNLSSTLPTHSSGNHITILLNAAVQGNPDYKPDVLIVKKGEKITVTNKDNVPHTVTSGTGPQDANSAMSFDTSIIETGASADIATANLVPATYPYYCSVHPYMTNTLIVR